jgi:hypothetical protein
MSRFYGDVPRTCFEFLPAGTILRRLAYALHARLGQWVTTEDLIDVAYEWGEGPLAAKEALKAHVHALRDALPGFVIDGDRYRGRRLRRMTGQAGGQGD